MKVVTCLPHLGGGKWNEIEGKPNTYPPSSHTHSKSEVGLGSVDNTADANKSVNYAASAGNADTVDGYHASAFAQANHTHNYAASNHTHAYLPLSGGTLTGDLRLKKDHTISWENEQAGTHALFNMAPDGGTGARVQFYPFGWSSTEAVNKAFSIGHSATTNNFLVLPYSDNLYHLGASNRRFKCLYAVTGTIQTSDRKKKKDIQEFGDKFVEDFIMGLTPVSYILKQNDSGRTHYGLIAQDVEELMLRLGMDTKDFAGFIKSPKYKTIYHEVKNEVKNANGEIVEEKHFEPEEVLVEGEYDYSLRYEEFISPVIKMVQVLNDKISQQQKEIEQLKSKIKLE